MVSKNLISLFVGLEMASILAITISGTAVMTPDTADAKARADQYATYRYFPEAAIRGWNGGRFKVHNIAFLDDYGNAREKIDTWISGNPDKVMGVQHAVVANRKLAIALLARSVALKDVVAVQRAYNGDLVVMLR
jgi:hypothetical protein